MSRKKALIVGLPLFAERLQKDLAEFDKENQFYCLNTYYSRKDRLKAFFLIPFVSTVYSINGSLDKSRVFDWAFFWKKKVMMTWVGTDVTKAKKLDKINQKYLNKAQHYCEVDWIQKELKELSIDAEILNFFNFKESLEVGKDDLKEIRVLSYISKNREEYYGWSKIIQAARENPEVSFDIVGTDKNDDLPKNVTVHGWVNNMQEFFDKSNVTVRLVDHDGLSGFVLESLYRGKQVIYSEPLEHTKYSKSSEEINAILKQFVEEKREGNSLLNKKGSDFVKIHFNKDVILSKLIEEIFS